MSAHVEPPIEPRNTAANPIVDEDESQSKPLKDFAVPYVSDDQNSISLPTINANHFKIKPSFINMVQRNMFKRMPSENSHTHLSKFTTVCERIKIGVERDNLRLRLFTFSLGDRPLAWLGSLEPQSITNWKEMTTAFLIKYFPPVKTAQYRSKIKNFKQQEGESLSETWERFKDLLRACPHHGLEKWLVVQSFYDGLFSHTRQLLDSLAGGAFMNRNVKEAFKIINDLSQSQNYSTSERDPIKSTPGKHEVNEITLLNAKLDALQRSIANFSPQSKQATVTSLMLCETCGESHNLDECCPSLADPELEQANMVNNSFKPNELNSNSYNQGMRNHPNFSYKNNQGATSQLNYQ